MSDRFILLANLNWYILNVTQSRFSPNIIICLKLQIQGKQKDIFLNHNLTAKLFFFTNPLEMCTLFSRALSCGVTTFNESFFLSLQLELRISISAFKSFSFDTNLFFLFAITYFCTNSSLKRSNIALYRWAMRVHFQLGEKMFLSR